MNRKLEPVTNSDLNADLGRGHKVTIRSVPAFRGRQMLDPYRYPDYEVTCPCGLAETFSKYASAEATKYVHERETPCEA